MKEFESGAVNSDPEFLKLDELQDGRLLKLDTCQVYDGDLRRAGNLGRKKQVKRSAERSARFCKKSGNRTEQ